MFKNLIGQTIEKIFMNEDELAFKVKEGYVSFGIDGDCCSTSVFYDFIGVKNILGKKVLAVDTIALEVGDDKKNYQEAVDVYGYRITVEDPTYGELTGVFSFRTYSNGYYGGNLNGGSILAAVQDVPELLDDCLCTENI